MAARTQFALICRIVAGVGLVLGFTSLALPFSRSHLASRPESLSLVNIVVVPISQVSPAKVEIKRRAAHLLDSPSAGDLDARLISEYGAVFMSHAGVVPPPRIMFSSDEEVTRWQAGVETAGGEYRLQTAAAEALEAARTEARAENLDITPRDTDAAARDYSYTVELWMSRVEPGLKHWVAKGRLRAEEAERIRQLPSREQAVAILELESKGMYFSKDFSKSILYSVAPPGTSQHLALLAFDVKEHESPRVREILERHGWFQTVQRDEPHFTYLGVTSRELRSLGLMKVTSNHRHYWIPQPSQPSHADLVARR